MTEAAILTEAKRLKAAGRGYRSIAVALGATRHQVRHWLDEAKSKDNLPALIEIEPHTAIEFAERITAYWRQSVEAIITAGRLLTKAKETLPHGEFLALIEGSLPFGANTAQRLMKIAADPRLLNAAHGQLLPPSWRTLYELTKLDDPTFEARVADGTIRADMARQDIAAAVKQERRAAHENRAFTGSTVHDLHALAASGFKAATILADPPWKFKTNSKRGEGRSANQHYRTDRLDLIKSLPVAEIAAPDAMLFMWMVDWCPAAALEVIEAWGFTHKTTAFTWAKQNETGEGWHMGQGYWTRANPEACWLATRGKPQRLNADVRQLIVAPVAEHSRKPDEIYDRIERLVEGPYLELYARRERKGWLTWGDELAFKMPATAPLPHSVIEYNEMAGRAA
jgi:N6-adenosine-specific RNA methylase IME4